MADTDLHVDLQTLQRDLREMGSLSEEQIRGTTESMVGHVRDLADIWFNRTQKPSLEVTRKSSEAESEEKHGLEAEPIQVSRKSSEAGIDEEQVPIQVRRKRPEPELDVEEEEADNSRALDEEVEPELGLADDLDENSEVLYSFDKHEGAEFAQGISEVEAQAILDLMNGVEGTRINNGENLLITSNGKKLFETNSKGEVTFSIAQRDPAFNRRTNPIKNSLEELKQRSQSIVQNAQSLKDDIQVSRGNGNDPAQSTGQLPTPLEPLSRSQTEVNSSATQVAQPVPKTPDILFEEAVSQSTMPVVTSAVEAQAAREKTESIAVLKDNLEAGEKVEIAEGVLLEAEHSSDGIVQIKMFELDNPEPVTIAKVNEQGDVVLDTAYTAPRYEAINAFIKNEGLSRSTPGKSPLEAVGSIDNQPDSGVNGSRTVLNMLPPPVGGEPEEASAQGISDPVAGKEVPTADDFRSIPQRVASHTVLAAPEPDLSSLGAETPSVSKLDLQNLSTFYNSSEGKKRPEAAGFNKRLGGYKQSLMTSAREARGNDKLTFARISPNFETDSVQLSPADRENLAAANDLAQSQEKSSPEKIREKTNGRS
jgi:hypothetical protein